MQGGQGGCGQDGNTWKLFELWETKKKIVMVDHVYGETKEVREHHAYNNRHMFTIYTLTVSSV